MARIRYIRSQRLEAVVARMAELLGLSHVRADRVFCSVSFNARTRAYARIWGTPGPFVKLGVCEPAYVIELVYENLEGAGCDRLLAVLLHELLHIPRGFTGGLRRHGEWSRWSSLNAVLKRLPPVERRRLCGEVREALEEARRSASR